MSGLFDDMDDLDSTPARTESPGKAAQRAPVPMVQCPRCRGTGSVTWGYVNIQRGECRQCKGVGEVRADWEKRREAFKKGEKTKATKLATKQLDWAAEHPAEHAWMVDRANRGNSFAQSLLEGFRAYGSLTPGQLAAVTRAITKDAELAHARLTEASARSVDVSGVGQNKLTEALNHAKARGMKRQPSLITGDIDFQRAPDSGKNPGCVYVRSRATDEYLGKITPGGRFEPSRGCTDEVSAKVAAVMLDPLAAAIEHGKLTGECACCKRKLTDPESVARGIGPVCATSFGF